MYDKTDDQVIEALATAGIAKGTFVTLHKHYSKMLNGILYRVVSVNKGLGHGAKRSYAQIHGAVVLEPACTFHDKASSKKRHSVPLRSAQHSLIIWDLLELGKIHMKLGFLLQEAANNIKSG